jgi:energy-converting hydrogenase Eha subunit E
MTFVAFDVAADVVLVRAVLRANDLLLGNLEI